MPWCWSTVALPPRQNVALPTRKTSMGEFLLPGLMSSRNVSKRRRKYIPPDGLFGGISRPKQYVFEIMLTTKYAWQLVWRRRPELVEQRGFFRGIDDPASWRPESTG